MQKTINSFLFGFVILGTTSAFAQTQIHQDAEHSVLALLVGAGEEEIETVSDQSETTLANQLSQQPIVEELPVGEELPNPTSADRALANVEMQFKPLPNRNVREANYDIEESVIHVPSRTPVPSPVRMQPQQVSQPVVLQSQSAIIKRQADLIRQQTMLIQQQNELAAQEAFLRRQKSQQLQQWASPSRPQAEVQRINQLQKNKFFGNKQPMTFEAFEESSQDSMMIPVEPGQVVVHTTSYQDEIERPSLENTTRTYQWDGDSQQLSQVAPAPQPSVDDMTELRRLGRSLDQQNPNDLKNYPMQDRLDFFRTEDSHINVPRGAYPNRDPFGVGGQKCCDEWAGQCGIKQLDFDCPCGGLKSGSSYCGENSCGDNSCGTCAKPTGGCNQCRPKIQLPSFNCRNRRTCTPKTCAPACGPKAASCTTCNN